MSSFPGIPNVIGDTDDDASIHLNSKVGRANPLPSVNSRDQVITSILNTESYAVSGRLNSLFTKYRNGESVALEEIEVEDAIEDEDEAEDEAEDEPEEEEQEEEEQDVEPKQDAVNLIEPEAEDPEYAPDESDGLDSDDDTEVEDDIEPQAPKGSKVSKPFKILQPIYVIIGLFCLQVILVVIALISRGDSSNSQTQPPNQFVDNYYEINSKFSLLDQQISALSSSQQSTLNTLNALDSQLVHIIDQSTKIQDMSLQATKDLLGKYESLDVKVNQLQMVSNDTEMTEKLSELVDVNQNLESIKSDIVNNLIETLPNHLPIYIKNSKLHYIPEFNKFLFNFIDSYIKQNNSDTWQDFLKHNKGPLQEYVSNIVKEMDVHGLDKTSFQKILNDKILENNQQITDKFNNLVDNLNLNDTGSTSVNGDKVLLSNLLDFLSKGSINVNYADYKLGSKILGFLTSLPNDNKSLSRKLMLGWYDYLVESTPSPESLKYNANNLLVGGGSSWQCHSDQCHTGIKLASPVIITDLILKSTNSETAPKWVSIYLKPSSKKSYDEVVDYVNEYKLSFNLPTSPNKYLKKFVKVKETKVSGSVNHVKLPLSLINLRIPVRDIFVEFYAPGQDTIEVFNLKVYGISEYNSYKFNDEFDLIVDNLKETVVEEPEYKFERYEENTINFGVLGEEEV